MYAAYREMHGVAVASPFKVVFVSQAEQFEGSGYESFDFTRAQQSEHRGMHWTDLGAIEIGNESAPGSALTSDAFSTDDAPTSANEVSALDQGGDDSAAPAADADFYDARFAADDPRNMVLGTEGADILEIGEAGKNYVKTHGGDDIITLNARGVLVYSGAGDDTVYGKATSDPSAPSDGIYLGHGNDTYIYSGGRALVSGDGGDDTLVLTGLGAEDVLFYVVRGEVYHDPAAAFLLTIGTENDVSIYLEVSSIEHIVFADGTRLNLSDNLDSASAGNAYYVDAATLAHIITPAGEYPTGDVLDSEATPASAENTIDGEGPSSGTNGAGSLPVHSDPQDSFSHEAELEHDHGIPGLTITGTEGDDHLSGTSGDDVISGIAGNDYIEAGAGDDLIVTGTGSTFVSAGTGDDTVAITTDFVTAYGNEGIDTLVLPGAFSDYAIDFWGGSFGSSYLTALDMHYEERPDHDPARGASFDAFSGFEHIKFDDRSFTLEELLANNDRTYVAQGTDRVNFWGGFGNDTLVGSEGDDALRGGKGNDIIIGNGGADYIDDAGGANSIDAGAGNDYIGVGEGNSTITGGAGDDYISGFGAHTAVYSGQRAEYSVTSTDIDQRALWTVTDEQPNRDGTDKLYNITSLKFADGVLNLSDGSFELLT